jgi:DNA-binding transcriptional regulator LsrR (DeoR family)
VQLAYVAEQHFLQGKTNLELAEELNVSRFKVARMLDDAIRHGIVQFNIRSSGPVDVDLSLELTRKFRLRRVVVVHSPIDEPSAVQQSVGTTAAHFAAESIVDGDVLGVTAGRTLSVMARRLTAIASCDVVQLAGIAGPIGDTAVDVVRRISVVSGGNAYSINAPLVVSSPEVASALRKQPELARTFAQLERVTIAFVAIGSWQPPDSELYDSDQVPTDIRRRMLEEEVAAEIGGIPLDSAGHVLSHLEAYSLAATADQLRRFPEVVGVAGGSRKSSAIRAALESGLIHSLVTDASAARALLNT